MFLNHGTLWSFISKKNEKDSAVCSGFLKYLTTLDNLKLIACLGDILQIFSRYQQKLQSDKLTVISMKSHTNSILTALNGMKNAEMIGRYGKNVGSKFRRKKWQNLFEVFRANN